MSGQPGRANGKPMTLKRLEATLARREEKLEAKLDGIKDDGISFELTGIDYIVRDESDRDRNLHAASNMEGMSIDGSQRASEMDMKLSYLRGKHARWGIRATGTPVANSMIELFTEFRYLRPDLLDQLGITDLDSYLSTFAQPVTGIGSGRHGLLRVWPLTAQIPMAWAPVAWRDDSTTRLSCQADPPLTSPPSRCLSDHGSRTTR